MIKVARGSSAACDKTASEEHPNFQSSKASWNQKFSEDNQASKDNAEPSILV